MGYRGYAWEPNFAPEKFCVKEREHARPLCNGPCHFDCWRIAAKEESQLVEKLFDDNPAILQAVFHGVHGERRR